jgi:orotate phosphoribosyltransferase
VTDRADLARRIDRTCRLTGSFALRSGQVSDTYFDKYRFEADPALLAAVAEAAEPLIPPGTQVLAGLELGGVPIATALGLRTGLPVAFVRRAAKTYGTARLAEGADIDGRHVLVIEDIITTGGQAAESTQALRELGATVDHVLCVINRTDGTVPGLDAVGLTIHSVLTKADLDHVAST